MLSQTHHNCIFMIVACCLTPKQSKQETKYSRNRQRQTNVHTNKHAFVILFCLFFMSHSVSLVSLREVESASHEHQDYTHPENLPVHPTTSICSDLWCWPGPQSLPSSVGTVGNTHLPVWLCGCYVSPVLAHAHTHTHANMHQHTHTHLGPYYEYLWCCVLEKKALD